MFGIESTENTELLDAFMSGGSNDAGAGSDFMGDDKPTDSKNAEPSGDPDGLDFDISDNLDVADNADLASVFASSTESSEESGSAEEGGESDGVDEGGDEPVSEQGTDNDTPVESEYNEIAKSLVQIGSIVLGEGEELPNFETSEQLEDFIKESDKARANNIIGDFLSSRGEDAVAAFNAIFVKGVDPKDYFKHEVKLIDYANMSLETEESQLLVVNNYYRTFFPDMDDDDIDVVVDKYKSKGELAEKSIAFKNKLMAKELSAQEALVKQAELKEQREVESQVAYQNKVMTVAKQALKDKYLGDIAVTESVANKVISSLSEKKYMLNGKRASSFELFLEELKKPENVEMAMQIELLRQKDFKLDSVKRKGVTEQAKGAFDTLRRAQKREVRSTNQVAVQNKNKFI